ncbi:MAG: hypothetical protein V1656_00725, partial [Candidatus Jorgensenbacteria bacterium]
AGKKWSVQAQINVARDIIEDVVLRGKTIPETRWSKLPEQLAVKIKETIGAIEEIRQQGKENSVPEPQTPEPATLQPEPRPDPVEVTPLETQPIAQTETAAPPEDLPIIAANETVAAEPVVEIPKIVDPETAQAETTPPSIEEILDLSGKPPEHDVAGELEIPKPPEAGEKAEAREESWWRRIWPSGNKESAETAPQPAVATPAAPAVETAKSAPITELERSEREELEKKREADPTYQALRGLGLADEEIEFEYRLTERDSTASIFQSTVRKFQFREGYDGFVRELPAEHRKNMIGKLFLGDKTKKAIAKKAPWIGDSPSIVKEIAVLMVEEILEGREPSALIIAQKLGVERSSQAIETIGQIMTTINERL